MYFGTTEIIQLLIANGHNFKGDQLLQITNSRKLMIIQISENDGFIAVFAIFIPAVLTRGNHAV